MYKKNKSSIFNEWGDALAAKVADGTLEIKVHKIANHIRRELIEMDLESAIHRMYEVILPKYKHENDETQQMAQDLLFTEKSDDRTIDSSTDYSLTNAPEIDIADRLAVCSGRLAIYLKEHKVEKEQSPDFMPTILALTEAIEEKAKFVNDGRQKICKLDQVQFLLILIESTLNAAFDEMRSQKMKQSKITSKQAKKFREFTLLEIDESLRPNTILQAKQVGFLGVPCEQCNKYRVKKEYNSGADEFQNHCYDCDWWQPMTMSPAIPV